MNIPKAIEVLERGTKTNIPPGEFEHLDAVKLGIEALKRELANRDNPDYVRVGQLPGETED